MAKTGVFDSDPAVMAKVVELKRELQRLARVIADDEDYSSDIIDQAKDTLSALKELRLSKRSLSLKHLDTPIFPEEYRCPLSKEMMRDPVIVSTGQTYDRPLIQKWLKSGNRTCPKTQQALSHTMLTPNHLIREMIYQWCKIRGIKLSDSVQYPTEEGVIDSDRGFFLDLLEKISSSTISEQKEAAKELRLLTKRNPSFRALFGETPNSIPALLHPMISHAEMQRCIDSDLQEDVITTLLNLSIHDNNKKLVAETPAVIPLLMEALRSGTIETRTNSAATLFTLSAFDSSKALIGKSGALKPLIDLLKEGNPLAMKDVASAIFNLCIIHENKARAVGDGAVRVILRKLIKNVHVDELLAILAMLSSNQKAVEEMGDAEVVLCLFGIIRDNPCGRNKENSIAILHAICLNDRSRWKEMREIEKTYGLISDLAKNGTSRAKRKANGILERLNRSVNITHTA